MPTLSGITTDAFGVLVILLVPVVMLQKLAITASWWILAITISEMLLNPIVYYYLKAPEPELVILRDFPDHQKQLLSLKDQEVSRLGKLVLHPGGSLEKILHVVWIPESKNVQKNIAALAAPQLLPASCG